MNSPVEQGEGPTGRVIELSDGWELARANPGALTDPTGLADLNWVPARVPGTVAGAIEELDLDPDASDWWFRVRFEAAPCSPEERLILGLQGLATIADVFLNGNPILSSRSMFASHAVDVSERISASNELVICCRALTPELAVRRKPRARWRTALVNGNLRFFRTMLLGRAPGFAPGPAVVGPWRPVTIERQRGFRLDEVHLRPRVDAGGLGVLAVRLSGQGIGTAAEPGKVTIAVSGPTGEHELTIPFVSDETGGLVAEGELAVPSVAVWWPHTHGDPVLYDVVVTSTADELHRGRVGFRELTWPPDWEACGFALSVNGIPVFARGAVWTPLNLRTPHQPEATLRAALEQVVAAGMNMLRLPGIGCYENDSFYDLCDELGLLIWQDFMLANLDYPAGEPQWDAQFEAEARQQLDRLAGRPSLAVLCGGSEVAQQVTMLGLDPELARSSLYTSTLPRLIEQARAAVPYIPNSPWGGPLPFRPQAGVANYYGVGAYLRDLTDARLAEVKFAGECLAFSNVPDDVTLEQFDAPGGLVPHHPVWKAGVPRDAGAGWDFEDVRDHYLKTIYGEDPVWLRSFDLRRYWELSRAITGEVMADVFGEWRRRASPTAGGLILWLRDLGAGAGWGVIDHTGRPKVAYHHLRRALAPVAVWITDEGLNGMAVHVANDGPRPLAAKLRASLYRHAEILVQEASVPIAVAGHDAATFDIEALLGHFADVGYAYRFGPPNHNVVVASLERGEARGAGLISQAFRFPTGWHWERDTAESLGIEASVAETSGGARVQLQSRRLLRGVRIESRGWTPADDAFTLEPGVPRSVELRRSAGSDDAGLSVTALNMADRLRI